jgi:putative ABC transport system permease protein
VLRNYLSAALGNLARNWLYAGVTIFGLAAGFAAAILIGLYVRDEYSFERFVPGYQDVYRLQLDLAIPGQKLEEMDYSVGTAGQNLALDFPEVQYLGRVEPIPQALGRGELRSIDTVAWADPDFFRVIAYPALAGDPVAALHAPDGLVLTRNMARKYFGEDAPIGKTLLVGQGLDIGLTGSEAPLFAATHPMRVLAVLKDLPSETHIKAQIYGSGRAAWSILALDDRHPSPYNENTLTYVRLKPGASPDSIRAGLPAFANRHYPSPNGAASALRPRLEALKDIHFSAKDWGDSLRQPGDRAVDVGIAAVGVLIILIAAINFITLMTARATRRAVEVGIRKVVGARRIDLMAQFMGEALIYVLASMLMAVALVELALPYVNAFLGRTIDFDYLGDPPLLAAIIGGALGTALLAGAYPAVVLSGFRPALALKGEAGQGGGSASVRQALVVTQFAILIGLIVISATIYRQTSFAIDSALRLNADQVLRIAATCEPALKQELASLRGVKDVACASNAVEGQGMTKTIVTRPGLSMSSLNVASVDVGYLEMHGLAPVAGRFFSRDHGEDMLLDRPGAGPGDQPSIVLNEGAVRRLGFKTPKDAVGASITWGRWTALTAASTPGAFPPLHSSQIIGVVRDFTLASIRTPIEPTMYYVDPGGRYLVAHLDGRRLPETLPAIDRIWKRTGHIRPIARLFENQAVQDLYRDVVVQGVAIAICAGLAILIACMGLFALAAFTTERRTKEIGVRKAMGANTVDVVRLLLWQFTRPVLWANLIAWPVAWWAMNEWLHGFAYRVDLPPWLFAAASGAAVLIAWATVSGHAWLVARARPVSALRYE